MARLYIRKGVHYGTADDMIARIEALTAEIARLKRVEAAADRMVMEVEGLHADGIRVTSHALDMALTAYRAAKETGNE